MKVVCVHNVFVDDLGNRYKVDKELTIGKSYEVILEFSREITLKNDLGEEKFYPKRYFTTVKEWIEYTIKETRDNKLRELGI